MEEWKALWDLKRGSQDALCWFIDKYTPYVTTVIYNIIGQTMSQADVEEVAADVFFALWQNAEKVKFTSVKSYLGTMARNMAKNKCRELGRGRLPEDNLLLLEGISPEKCLEEKELRREVWRCVMGMKMPEREIFLRCYYYHQSMEQISQEMGINLSTVKTKLRRGREKLRKVLADKLT